VSHIPHHHKIGYQESHHIDVVALPTGGRTIAAGWIGRRLKKHSPDSDCDAEDTDPLHKRNPLLAELYAASVGYGHPFSDDVREVVLKFAHERRAQGASWRAIARARAIRVSARRRFFGIPRA